MSAPIDQGEAHCTAVHRGGADARVYARKSP